MFKVIGNVCASIVFVTLIAGIPLGILANVPFLSVLCTVAVLFVVIRHMMEGCP